MWKFTRISRNETRATNKLKEFFPDAGDAESVIRETGQNVLDAKSEFVTAKPVVLNISLGSKKKSEVAWLFDSFDGHVKSVINQTKHTHPKEIADEFDYLLIEDFNTTGFTGTFDNEAEDGKGSLISFWWEEGESSKVKGSGGSHGVGKVTLSEASQAGLFFANSIREDDEDEILFGYCRIGRHEHKGKPQREYARFGKLMNIKDGDSYPRPYSRTSGDDDSIDRFKKAFDIKRSESGSSLVVPSIDRDVISYEKILEQLLDNFYLPIMKGLLEVRLHDRETNEETLLNVSNFSTIAKEKRNGDPTFLQKIKLAECLILKEKFFNTSHDFEFTSEKSKVTADSFYEERLIEMREEYSSGIPVKVRLNVKLDPTGMDQEVGTMELIVQKRANSGETIEDHFYDAFRGDVLIQDEKLRTSKASAILDIYRSQDEVKSNPLSEFMKYCEDPGHKNWAASVNRKHEKYLYTRTWQKNFVRTAVKDIILMLEDEGEKEIQDFADDLFFIFEKNEEEIPGSDPGEDGVDGDGQDSSVRPTIDIQSSIPLVTITKTSKGISIKNTKKATEGEITGNNEPFVRVEFCYEMFGVSKAVWRRTGQVEIDLDSDKYEISCENVKIENVEMNTLVVSLKSNEFSIVVDGFDINRQLYVDVKDRELSKHVFGASE